MSKVNDDIVSIFNSRTNIASMLEYQGYDISDYEGISITEVHTMNNKDQLDMLFTNNDTKSKTYVKYIVRKSNIRKNDILEIKNDLFEYENILNSKTDTLIIIAKEINSTLYDVIKDIYSTENKYINVFTLSQLQFNILDHNYVPKHKVVNKEEIKMKYNIINDKEFPEISRFDPAAMAIGLKPGEICEIVRNSKTSVIGIYYRYCVNK